MDDAVGRYLLQLLDGTRDRAALLDELTRAVESGAVAVRLDGAPVRKYLADRLEPSLAGLAKLGLLVAG
jgi:hypothetical protein